MKLVRCIFLVLNKCIKYLLKKESVQKIVKKKYKIEGIKRDH